MNLVQHKSFQGEEVNLDGHHYDHCDFDSCVLVYRGLDLFSLSNCRFYSCGLRMADYAQRTMTALSLLYHSGFRPMIDNELAHIQHGSYLPPNLRQSPPDQP